MMMSMSPAPTTTTNRDSAPSSSGNVNPLARAVRRVYIRHPSLKDDLFVPTENAIRVGDLRLVATRRLAALGAVDLREGLRPLHRKRGAAIDDDALIDEKLTDGEVLEAYSAGIGDTPPVREHVLVSHAALRDGVRIWVPAGDCTTVGELVKASQNILRQTGDRRLCVSGLARADDGTVLDTNDEWRNVIESGTSLIGTHGEGPTVSSSAIPKDPTVFKVRHRLDSSVWSKEMVVAGLGEGLEIKAKDLRSIGSITPITACVTAADDDDDLTLMKKLDDLRTGDDDCTTAGGGTGDVPRDDESSPTRRMSSSYGLLLGSSSSPPLSLFANDDARGELENDEDVVKKMPGGSWAVFRGEARKSP